jgi:hypothetical protein
MLCCFAVLFKNISIIILWNAGFGNTACLCCNNDRNKASQNNAGFD